MNQKERAGPKSRPSSAEDLSRLFRTGVGLIVDAGVPWAAQKGVAVVDPSGPLPPSLARASDEPLAKEGGGEVGDLRDLVRSLGVEWAPLVEDDSTAYYEVGFSRTATPADSDLTRYDGAGEHLQPVQPGQRFNRDRFPVLGAPAC